MSRKSAQKRKRFLQGKEAYKKEQQDLAKDSSGYAIAKTFVERVGSNHSSAAYVRHPKQERELEIWEDHAKGSLEILVKPPGSGKKR